MTYVISQTETTDQWYAVTEFTIPDFSYTTDMRVRALLRSQLKSIGVKQTEPFYEFMIGENEDDYIEVLAVTVYVAIEEPVETDLDIEYVREEAGQTIIRIEADDFVDVHAGLAEWMHDNDCVADGDIRRVLVENETRYVFDCPVRKAED